MKKIITILTMLFSLSGISQAFTEGFEINTNWILDSGPWSVYDNDTGTNQSWNVSSSFNFQHTGLNYARIQRENVGAGNTSKDYLITPLIHVPIDGKLKFFTRTQFIGDQGTRFYIKIKAINSTNPSDPAPLAGSDDGYVTLKMYTEQTLNETFNVYQERMVDLSSYAGQDVYIAFDRENTQTDTAISGDTWIIDDVQVDVEHIVVPPPSLTSPQNYCYDRNMFSQFALIYAIAGTTTTGDYYGNGSTQTATVNYYDSLGNLLNPNDYLTSNTYYVSYLFSDIESPRIPVNVNMSVCPPIGSNYCFSSTSNATTDNDLTNISYYSEVFIPINSQTLYHATYNGIPIYFDSVPLIRKYYGSNNINAAPLPLNTPLVTGTYYVSYSYNNGTVETTRTPLPVVIYTAPAASQEVCNGSTISSLAVSGTNPEWKLDCRGVVLDATTIITAGTYVVSQTIDGCNDICREVAVTISPSPALPSVASNQNVSCQSTVASLVATGTAIQWFTTPTGGTALSLTAPLTAGTYYVSQTINGCVSDRVAVNVTTGTNALSTDPNNPTRLCTGKTVADLIATITGTSINCYLIPSGGTALAPTTVLTTNSFKLLLK